jgi:hypothetical protein
MTKEEVRIDPRIHSMIIGRRGMGIRKIMTDFKVEIKLPKEGEAEPDLVVVRYLFHFGFFSMLIFLSLICRFKEVRMLFWTARTTC